MVTTAAPTVVQDQPISLPSDAVVDRALRSFDLISTVDSYKAGVLYVGPGQTKESEFLMAWQGSADYERFLGGLGFRVSLQTPLRFNAQGLRYPADGEWTIAWRDRVTEIVFMVPTMMPPDDDNDIEWTRKKMHVGNCHVNIVFNQSGRVWSFDQLPTEFNSVNIIITPADVPDELGETDEEKMPQFYQVHVQTKEKLQDISPAVEPKIVSWQQLPRLVRLIAMNANVFSQVLGAKGDTEFPSFWRARLQAIKKLKAQVQLHSTQQTVSEGHEQGTGTGTGLATQSSGAGRHTPVPRESGSGQVEGDLVKQLDFSRWTS
jgi:hypothetical protein